jgi:hypothetical protein
MIVRYDFTCDEHTFEVIAQSGDTAERPCQVCGKPAHWKPSFQAQPEFKPFYHEHITPEKPVLIESRKHYAEVCRQHGLYGPYNESEKAKNRSEV